jgi:hypothetical protein
MTTKTRAMSHTSWRWPVLGTLLAIAATAVMDVVGLINVLPLLLLFFLFWYLQRMSRAEIGWTWAGGATMPWPFSIPRWCSVCSV